MKWFTSYLELLYCAFMFGIIMTFIGAVFYGIFALFVCFIDYLIHRKEK